MTKSPEAAQQISSLTSLRGILALWVVLFHFWNDIVGLFPSLSPLTPAMRRGHLAVPGFFLLSGLVLARKYTRHFRVLETRGVLSFLALRLARIYPVHLATLLCVAAMVVASRHLGYTLSDTGYSGEQFLLNLFLLQAWTPHLILSWNYPSWSISSEWFVYLLFPFLVRVLSPTLGNRLWASCAFVIATAVSIVILLTWGTLPFRELAVVVPTFFAGMAASHLVQAVRAPADGSYAWLPVAIGIAAFGACYLPGQVGLLLLLVALFAIVPCLAFLTDSPRYLAVPPLLLLGEVSYSLYMTHTLAQKVLYRVLPVTGFAHRSPGIRLGVLGCYLALISLLCLLSYVLVERPGREWGRRRVSGGLKAPRWTPSGIPG